MVKKLKITLDRYTLACLLQGYAEMSDRTRRMNVYESFEEDWCTATTQNLVDEMMDTLRSHPAGSTEWKIKLLPSGVCALLYLMAFTKAGDPWTVATLGSLTEDAHKYLADTRSMRTMNNTPRIAF